MTDVRNYIFERANEKMTFEEFREWLPWPRSGPHFDYADIEKNDISYIRNKVLTCHFCGCFMTETEKDYLPCTGEAYLEMLYVNKLKGEKDERILNDEFWYIAVWLKNNRISYKVREKFLYQMKTKNLAQYLAENVYSYLDFQIIYVDF